MNKHDYLNKQRYSSRNFIIEAAMDLLYGVSKRVKRAFTKTTIKPEPKTKIALPKQAIQAERDHGYLWI